MIDGQSTVDLEIANPHEPGKLYPRVEAGRWEHPIEELDLAVARFDPPPGYTLTALQLGVQLLEHLPPQNMLAMPFHYVGLLAPLNRVMARSGTLGAVDQPDIEGEPDYRYRAHLADCRSYAGFSGSPCFIEYAVPSLTPNDPPVPPPASTGPLGRIMYLHLLCGMFTSHLAHTNPPGGMVSLPGVGIILSSDEIWRALMEDDLVKERRELDEAEPDLM